MHEKRSRVGYTVARVPHALARGRGRGHFARDVICSRVAQLLSLLTHRETMLAMRPLSLLNKGALIDYVCKQVGGQDSRNNPLLQTNSMQTFGTEKVGSESQEKERLCGRPMWRPLLRSRVKCDRQCSRSIGPLPKRVDFSNE